jgi:hypothetical protein
MPKLSKKAKLTTVTIGKRKPAKAAEKVLAIGKK